MFLKTGCVTIHGVMLELLPARPRSPLAAPLSTFYWQATFDWVIGGPPAPVVIANTGK
jgi:hypothetical protein